MSEVILRVNHLSKKYIITRTAQQIVETPRQPLLQTPDHGRPQKEIVWALNDVSFEVCHGEIIGVMGSNGAGKSTLLKIVSQLTEPTSGWIDIKGRIGSLLEVGTGFHPDLTGRENMYLNGAILGMNRREISRRFDEIVEFSEVERYIDTPVKFYSSGMYMRLAFSVAVHLESEITVIDEVLAVGDSGFQHKCLRKMRGMAENGRTILFVSHNDMAISQLCTRAVLLQHGKVVYNGDVPEAIKRHLAYFGHDTTVQLAERTDREGDQSFKIVNVELLTAEGEVTGQVEIGQTFRLRFHYEAHEPHDMANVFIAFNVISQTGSTITNLNTRDVGKNQGRLNLRGSIDCVWQANVLREGLYTCSVYSEVNGKLTDWVRNGFTLRVLPTDYYHTGVLISRSQAEIVSNYDWEWPEGFHEEASS